MFISFGQLLNPQRSWWKYNQQSYLSKIDDCEEWRWRRWHEYYTFLQPCINTLTNSITVYIREVTSLAMKCYQSVFFTLWFGREGNTESSKTVDESMIWALIYYLKDLRSVFSDASISQNNYFQRFLWVLVTFIIQKHHRTITRVMKSLMKMRTTPTKVSNACPWAPKSLWICPKLHL